MSESSRHAIVVPITLEKHPNADLLSLVKVDDFQCVVNTEQWQGRTSAVYLEPETIVKTTRSEFSFLKRENRDEEVIRAKRLRGEWSLGLLVPTPEGFNLGDDCWDFLELKHYEPEEQWIGGIKAGDEVPAPAYWANLSKYDVDNYKKYNRLLQDDELVGVTEKLHGSNWAGVYSDGTFHVKSRGYWRKYTNELGDADNDYGLVLLGCPELQKYLMDNPNHLACGEVIGRVQKGFSYGIKTGEVSLRLFDIRKPDYKYMSVTEFRDTVETNKLPSVKFLGGSVLIPHNKDVIFALSEGKTLEGADHIREGIVIRPAEERYESRLNGRLILKCVSNTYLEKQGK